MDLALFARVLAWMLAAFFLGTALGSLARSRIDAARSRGRPAITLTAPAAVAPDNPFFVDAVIVVTEEPSNEGPGLAVLRFEGVGLTAVSTSHAFRIEKGKHSARFEVSVPSATKDTVTRGRVELVTGDGVIASACVKMRVDAPAHAPEAMASST
jgi:hypothetical protein